MKNTYTVDNVGCFIGAIIAILVLWFVAWGIGFLAKYKAGDVNALINMSVAVTVTNAPNPGSPTIEGEQSIPNAPAPYTVVASYPAALVISGSSPDCAGDVSGVRRRVFTKAVRSLAGTDSNDKPIRGLTPSFMLGVSLRIDSP